jgi:hypothetical protein
VVRISGIKVAGQSIISQPNSTLQSSPHTALMENLNKQISKKGVSRLGFLFEIIENKLF